MTQQKEQDKVSFSDNENYENLNKIIENLKKGGYFLDAVYYRSFNNFNTRTRLPKRDWGERLSFDITTLSLQRYCKDLRRNDSYDMYNTEIQRLEEFLLTHQKEGIHLIPRTAIITLSSVDKKRDKLRGVGAYIYLNFQDRIMYYFKKDKEKLTGNKHNDSGVFATREIENIFQNTLWKTKGLERNELEDLIKYGKG